MTAVRIAHDGGMRAGAIRALAAEEVPSFGPYTDEADWPVFIRLFGGFQLLVHGEPVALRGRGKSEALLQILALQGPFTVPRDTLLDRLWPEGDTDLASQSLNSLVYSLHKLLRHAMHGASLVASGDGGYRLNRESGAGTDIECFVELARAADREAVLGNDAEAVRLYGRAIKLYRGDLQSQGDVDAVIMRENLRARYLTLLARLAQYHYLGAEYTECLEYALRLLGSEPCREDAHRMVMACYLRRGERAQALRQYRLCETVLRSEFGARPEPATTLLFEQIRDDPASVQ